MAATMKDIALKTGLGLSTISSYVNGGNVREKNRIKLEKAIAELGYEVNEAARSLKTGKSKTIGIVIPELSNMFATSIISAMEDRLRDNGYATIVCDCRSNMETEKESVHFLLQKRVDALVNMPMSNSFNHLQYALERKTPVVLLDRLLGDIGCDSVIVDNIEASKQAVSMLWDYGHRNIGILCGQEDLFTSQQRLQGYRAALLEKGFVPKESLIRFERYTIEGGVNGMNALLEQNPDMSAVFVTNDEMMMGAAMVLNEKDITIPDKISFIGFDNEHFAKAYRPRLTIITQPIKKLGETVADILLERLGDNSKKSCQNVCLKTSFLMGKSVSPFNF